jgi:5-methylthioadenosine/S-adenosylhomocysteine deaminase
MTAAAPSQSVRRGRVSLLQPRFLLPVRPAGQLLEDHSVVVRGDTIEEILPRQEAELKWPRAERVDLPGHVLLPGLINAHTHAPMTLLRGFADDMDLNTWLKDHIWPVENRFVGPGFVRDGTRLAVAEMLRSGTTCFNDMYFFPDATIEACREAGIRASVGITIIEFESAWATSVDRYIEKGLRLHDEWHEDPLISFTLSPHSPYTVSDPTLRRIADLSGDLALPVHIHLLETEWEVKQSYQQHDLHPVSRLEGQGLMNRRLQAVHMTQVSAEDIDRFAAAGASVVHCPQSNLKLASGFCPVSTLSGSGVNVALGTDGAASNNDLDMLAEAQTAALLAKGVAGDACALDAFQAVEMMTLNGARALGLEDQVGSIEAGKKADLVALDLRAPETQPLHHVISQLIYAASSRHVSDVWVNGRRLLKSGELTTINLESVLESAREWRDCLARHESAKSAQGGD